MNKKEITLQDLLPNDFYVIKGEMVCDISLEKVNTIAGILTNLQQENQSLKDRIDKTVDFLNKKWIEGSDIYDHFSAGCGCGNNFDFEEDRDELLEILKGDK